MRTLIYFPGSPFARKVRIVLAEKDLAYEKDAIDTFPLPVEMRRINPSRLVPILIDGERELFESNLIIDYLLETYPNPQSPSGGEPPLATSAYRAESRWQDAKILSTIETMAESLVSLSYMTWSGLRTTGPNLMGVDPFEQLRTRIESCLDYLDDQATVDGFIPGVFSIHDIALICPLLWTDARIQFPWRGRPKLEAIVARYAERPSVVESAIPVEDPNPWAVETP